MVDRTGCSEARSRAGEGFGAGKAKHFWRMGEHGLGEDLGVPRFHDHHGASEVLEIVGGF